MKTVKEIVSKMTLEEKAGLCSGADFWHLKGLERFGIPSVMVSDGPHGLRKQDMVADHLGINDSIPAVCFPAACCTAGSFDRELLAHMGQVIAEECLAEEVSVILGPGMNIKRSPLCGRNFEYFSEDPYLTGQLAKAFVQRAQACGVGTSPKHFAVNNQEKWRMSISAEVDEQTLREIYLPAFETVVKEAQPKTIMASYNRINGVYASEHHRLLTEILRDEWGFDGYVMSDWGAVDRRVEALKAGLDLEMPSSNGINDAEIVQAVKDGRLEEAVLDQAVERILTVILDYTSRYQAVVWDKEKDHAEARRIAEESAVLLKNEGVLPLNSQQKIAFIGEFAKNPRFQGGGSSHINAFKVSNALDAVSGLGNVHFAQGYRLEEGTDEQLIAEAVTLAKASDVAVVFAGLPESYESEGYDRQHIDLPANQNALIEAVAVTNPKTVVVLHNGSVVAMPWASQVAGILDMYLAGQAVGEATVNLLYGKVNPSGRLAETFPYQLEDNPSHLNFPGDGDKVQYKEGLFVGYRYYDKKKMDVQFPFGYGLSYTSFSYQDLKVSHTICQDTDQVEVSVRVTNSGNRAGKEVVQLYVNRQVDSSLRPVRELKGFEKIALAPGESKEVTFTLTKRSFAEYNTLLHDWYVPSGDYVIEIGKDSRTIVLSQNISVKSSQVLPFVIHRNTTLGELMENPKTRVWTEDLKRKMDAFFHPDGVDQDNAVSDDMGDSIFKNMPLRGVTPFVGMTSDELDAVIRELNEQI
ncbi:glycoside hydrolase family 3 C-terminal domain-containing protein [Streptococcus ovuberis]|uniref:Glycosyl hydrolase n=1 Tax=Streptococcus ovuberis TaxID=1936207 RepID=A0A7X6S119_9STRE|nr:glycoside hydrolase family 3 C-terminal domain-containing protein [Streptococcus ovuberis]NKZ19910.1 glycosyl hydrolase [Streptococcus ovuberis]